MDNSWADKFYRYSRKAFRSKNFTRFTDGGGYSLIDAYKDSFKRRMGVGSDGNQVPFFKFIFDATSEDGDYVPLSINVAVTTKVQDGTEVRYMLNDSRIKHLKPIELISRDEFYISKADGKVYERKSKKYMEVKLESLYQRLYNVHVSDVLTFKGAYIRTKILIIRKFPSLVLAKLAWVLGGLVYFIKKDRYTYNVITERFRDRRSGDREQVSASPTTEGGINFFGYKVRLWTLYTYSFLAIVSYLFWKKPIKAFLIDESIDSIINIAFAIFSIVTYDRIIPDILKSAIRLSSIAAYDLQYKGVKLKI